MSILMFYLRIQEHFVRLSSACLHENLHENNFVCVQAMQLSVSGSKKIDCLENSHFKGFQKIKKLASTWLSRQICQKHQHDCLVKNQSQSINQSINHVSEVST